MAVVVTAALYPELVSLVSVSAMLETVSVVQMVSLVLLRVYTSELPGTATSHTREPTTWVQSSRLRVSTSSSDPSLVLLVALPKVAETGKVSATTLTLLVV